MSEDLEGAGVAKEFLVNWVMVLITTTVAVVGLAGIILIIFSVLLGPLLLGAWVEFGIFPWEISNIDGRNVGSFWFASALIWWIFIATGLVAATLTMGEGEDNE